MKEMTHYFLKQVEKEKAKEKERERKKGLYWIYGANH